MFIKKHSSPSTRHDVLFVFDYNSYPTKTFSLIKAAV